MAESVKNKLGKALLSFLAVFPFPVLRCFSALLFFPAWYGHTSIRRAVAINIGLCFPLLDASEQQSLCKQAVRETLRTGMEMPRLWLNREHNEALGEGIEGQEYLDAALAAGKGVIMVTPHLGNWEYLIVKMASLYPCSVLCNNADDIVPFGINELIQNGRMKTGARMVEARQGVKVLVEALQRGEIVMIAPDQIPTKNKGGIFADFFAQPAATMTLIPRLVRISQAGIVSAFAKREACGRYRLIIKPFVRDTGIRADNLAEAVLNINQTVEDLIAEAPSQYLWTYKRFRLGPEGRTKVYKKK